MNNGPQVLNTLQEQQQLVTSPSHEFSFAISLQSSKIPENLTPAGDIFFHGHLLPLHLLSHLPPVSPRSSTNSLDSFTLPTNDLQQIPPNETKTGPHHHDSQVTDQPAAKGRPLKPKSFSLFGKSAKAKNDDDHRKGGAKFDVVRFLKNYMRLMRPSFVSFRSGTGKKEKSSNAFQSSLSGNLLVKGKKEPLRGRRGGLSAPVTTRNSPTNSGHLMASESSFSSGPVGKSDSDMEELQAAISAAIAHCKNSIAATTTTTTKQEEER